MVTKHSRAKPGDVLELEVGNRFAYVHYVGKHSEYGDAILVNPKLSDRLSSVTGKMFSEAYFAFYPVAAAVGQGLVRVVGHLPPPEVPQRLRRAGVRSGRRVDTWIIEGGSGEIVKAKLSEDEQKLPIAAIWNHDLLVQRIAEGWTPVQEGRAA
jgi:hypothetical protein